MSPCDIHKDFFDENCNDCKVEYAELKGVDQYIIRKDGEERLSKKSSNKKKQYKEFSEERAKKLYEELLIQFLRTKSMNEFDAAKRARQVIRKQCAIRGIQYWNWLK